MYSEERPWGKFTNLLEEKGFKVKRIEVKSHQRLSLQSHKKRDEHWVIVHGKGKVQVGDEVKFCYENEHIYIPKNSKHRIENIGDELLIFIETQYGEYLGEDDIIRYEDDYNRV